MIDKSKIIVTGGKGVMGRKIPFGIKLDKEDLDITLADSVKAAFDRYDPQMIIHLAALKDKVYCQTHPADAYAVNVLGTFNVARECRSRNIPMIFISSSYVFDGKARHPYKEEDLPNPLSVYGRTKLAGELIARDLVPKSAVIRLGLLYGAGIEDSFINKTVKRILAGEKIEEYANRFSLTNIENFIEGLSAIIEKDMSGTFHLVEAGGPSYYEVADYLRERLNPSAIVSAAKNTGDDYKIPRGGFEVLEPSAVFSSPGWKKSLDEHLSSLKQ